MAAMPSGTGAIQPLSPKVAKQIESSISIASLNNVLIGLVKNSLDAGSSQLDIDVDYGRGSCTVEDNGCGIPPSEFSDQGNLAKPHRELNVSPSHRVSTNSSRYFKGRQRTPYSWAQWHLPLICRCSIHTDDYLSLSS